MEKSPEKLDDSDTDDKDKTPTKLKTPSQSDIVTPQKDLNNLDAVKGKENSPESKIKEDKTPEKTSNPESDQKYLPDIDDGMLSTVEQARLLIAASKTPSKTVNKTPVKQNNSSGKRSVESSPITPGKQRRVDLITLSSPKTKRFKQG